MNTTIRNASLPLALALASLAGAVLSLRTSFDIAHNQVANSQAAIPVWGDVAVCNKFKSRPGKARTNCVMTSSALPVLGRPLSLWNLPMAAVLPSR